MDVVTVSAADTKPKMFTPFWLALRMTSTWSPIAAPVTAIVVLASPPAARLGGL